MSKSHSKCLLSGVKPTGTLHLGNYLGAMKQFVELQDQYKMRVFIADYHALTGTPNPEDLRRRSTELAAAYIAIGLDPTTTRIFRQSDVPDHAALSWILSTQVPSSYLTRAHAFKDAEQNGAEINAATMYYPILMAADILMYDADVVPVGMDQKQHLEYTRDIAERFNNRYGETFMVPDPLIVESANKLPGTDGRKMSKSYDNTIPLFGDRSEIEAAVRAIPTDSQAVEDPKENYEKDTLYILHALVTPQEQLAAITAGYRDGGLSYKESKDLLVESIEGIVSPIRERYNKLLQDSDQLNTILNNGATVAREEAAQKMEVVRKCVGLTPNI